MSKKTLKEIYAEQQLLQKGEISGATAAGFQAKSEARVDRYKANGESGENYQVAIDEDGDFEMNSEESIRRITEFVNDKRGTGGLNRTSNPKKSKPLESKHSGRASKVQLVDTNIDLTPVGKLSTDIYVVVDTNFFLSNLQILDQLGKLAVKYHYTIIIPSTVIHELDALKSSTKDLDDGHLTVGKLARSANNWIYNNFSKSNPFVKGQKYQQVINRDLTKDDSIYDCCMYFKLKKRGLVVLVTNDTNLSIKALSDDILTVSYSKGIDATSIAKSIYVKAQEVSKENVEIFDDSIEVSEDNLAVNVGSTFLSLASLDFPELSQVLFSDVSVNVVPSFINYVTVKCGQEPPDIVSLQSIIEFLFYHWQVLHEFFKGISVSQSKSHQPIFEFRADSHTVKINKVLDLVTVPQRLFHLKRFCSFWMEVLKIVEDPATRHKIAESMKLWKDILEHETSKNIQRI